LSAFLPGKRHSWNEVATTNHADDHMDVALHRKVRGGDPDAESRVRLALSLALQVVLTETSCGEPGVGQLYDLQRQQADAAGRQRITA
jgi:hypothetical protein